MLTLTLGNINDDKFINSLNKLSVCTKLGVKTSYNVGRLLKEIDRETKEARDKYIDVIKQYAVLDEKGNLVPQVKKEEVDGKVVETPLPGTWQFKEPANQEEKDKMLAKWKKANEEFMNIEVAFEKVKRIDIDELEGAELAPVDINNLEPVLNTGADLSLVQ